MWVAPFTGAWVEISGGSCWILCKSVAPFTGAWVEICGCNSSGSRSGVAPFTGAWVEIASALIPICALIRRTLHGCVG